VRVVFDVTAKRSLQLLSQKEYVGVDGVRLMVAIVSAMPIDVSLQEDQPQSEGYRKTAKRQQQE
jgi:riboflavin synthase alpha subunit